ncbi:glycosyltransferase family 4 protein [Azospirillum doebereinerae]|uniref:glycosyltransferase family 4 protein n=1 Tax=Azospirillum doebereinerae TaxID=92933 RepID=UPI001EE5A35F|nr:glycosyltransferase family 4 protein [Azospirillum doebereinerae]MCG5239091.1 glycosyltransferase family 4 protein [Azospirillum doebereinerae]
MTAPITAQRRPKLLYLVTEDWYFWSHRLPMARAARDAGFDVTVAARVDKHGERIAAEGFRVLPLAWQRRSVNPLGALGAVREIAALYRREAPDIVHHVAMKPVLLGGLAAMAARVPAVVNALTGLGSAFIGSGGLKSRVAGAVARPLLRAVLSRPNSLAILQNADDRRTLVEAGLLDADRAWIVRGSGIDTTHYKALPEPPEPPVTVGCVARLLADKGVAPLVEAQQALRAKGLDVRLLLAGTPDPENPTSIPQADLDRWAALPGVELAGHVADVRAVWSRCHVAVLASRREGLPKSLLEAAACGRAIVATDVPGCREVAHAGENALLVPPDDANALAGALETLVRDSGLRARFGEASRRLVESDMAADRVGARTVELYRSLLTNVHPSAVPAEAS